MSFDGPVVLTNPFALPDVNRGSETLIQGLARWLGPRVPAGVSVLAGGRRSETYTIDGVSYRRVHSADLRRVHRELDAEITFVPAMAARLRRDRPALVHSFLYPDAAAARLAGIPYVVSYGGIALPDRFRKMRVRWRLFHLASRQARRVFCPSRAAADHMRNVYGYPAEVLPNALHAADYWMPEVEREPGLILCAATPDDTRKRVDILFKAFALLAGTDSRVSLAIAGGAKPSTRQALFDLLPEETRSRVRFLGNLEPTELRQWYARSDLTCLASVNEAFGMVLVESLAAGTPVVGARHGAIPEIVTPEVGTLFEPDDPSSCADAIRNVLNCGLGAMAEDCRNRAAKFDWDTVGQQYLSAYEEAV